MKGHEPIEILLVEDNPYDAKLTLRALNKHVANSIQLVHDGAQALDFIFAGGIYSARKVENGPTLVLLDIKLPKVDGLEVLRRIRDDPRTSSQLVVLLTSSAERRDVATAYQYHANSYIVKPVDFKQFTNAVGEVGLYWMLLNRPPEAPAAAIGS
jgi:two-component system response regulator